MPGAVGLDDVSDGVMIWAWGGTRNGYRFQFYAERPARVALADVVLPRHRHAPIKVDGRGDGNQEHHAESQSQQISNNVKAAKRRRILPLSPLHSATGRAAARTAWRRMGRRDSPSISNHPLGTVNSIGGQLGL